MIPANRFHLPQLAVQEHGFFFLRPVFVLLTRLSANDGVLQGGNSVAGELLIASRLIDSNKVCCKDRRGKARCQNEQRQSLTNTVKDHRD